MRITHLVGAVAVLLAGCLDSGPELDLQTGALAGTPTTARPEIGRLTYDGTSAPCMATLIAPQVVITAARCVNTLWKNTSETPLPGSAFSFTDKTGTLRTYAIDRVHSFFRDWYDLVLDDDFGTSLAIAHLAQAVPSTQAAPAALALRLPADGNQVSVWGWDRYETLGKQVRDFGYVRGPAPFVWDVVDDGGPAFLGYAAAGGDLWGTVHRYVNHGGFEEYRFTPVSFYGKQIEEVMHTWNGPDEVGGDRPGMDYTSLLTASAQLCRAQCEAQAPCKAFTWVASSTRCYLKEGVPELRPGAGVTSGLPTRFELGTDRPGNDYAWLVTPRAEVCAATCARDSSKCRTWTWVGVANGSYCWLKGAGQSAVASAGMTSGVIRAYESDVDRPGYNYAVYTKDDAMQCASVCAGEARCKAYTYESFRRYCWLKDSVPWAAHSAGMTSSVRRGLEVDVNRAGSEYRSFTNDSLDPAECQATCARESQCQAWTFDGRTGFSGKCSLKNGVPARTTLLGAVSGLKAFEFL